MLRILLVLGLFAQACGGDPGSPVPDGGTPSTDVDSVAMEAVLVLASGGGLQLLDPSTGLPSPTYTIGATSLFSPVAVSPDGTRLALIMPDGVALAEVTIDATGPSLTITTEWSLADLQRTRPLVRLQWTPDGERLVYDTGAIDLESGEVFACEEPVLAGIPATTIAGGHDILCRYALLRDDLPLAEELSQGLSADGQLAGFEVHLPSGARRANVGLAPSWESLTPLGDGDHGRFPRGPHGDYVVSEAAGFVEVFRVETETSPPTDGATFSPHGSFSTGEAPVAEGWAISAALLSYFDEGDGRRYSFVGTTADGTEAIYRINSHVIEYDTLTNVIYERPIQAALVAVSRTGETRGLRTGELGQLRIDPPALTSYSQRAGQPDLLDPLGLVDLGEGDLLVPSGASDIFNATSWVGWVEGEPWAGEALGILSPDGRWFAGTRDLSTGLPQAVCLTAVEQGAARRCIVPPTGLLRAEVNAFVYGTKRAFDGEPPRILATSRTAAWAGSPVVLHGLRFGAGGTLTVGGVSVPESAISEWSDRRIVFAMDPSLPESGAIQLDTPNGSSAGGRVHWLHRTPTVTTPFDEVPFERVPLGQGINEVDLGALEGFDPIVGNADPIRLTEELRLDDGRYAILTEGASEPTDGRALLVIGDFSRPLFYRLENRLVSNAGWALASRLEDFTPGREASFVHVAGELIVMGLGEEHPFLQGERLALIGPADRDPGTLSSRWGVPDFWRERPDGTSAWAMVKFNSFQHELRRQTGWMETPGGYVPVHADAPQLIVPGMVAVEAAGDVVIVTGQGESGAGFALSTDGGLTFAPSVSVGGADFRYREPLRVDASGGTFFLVMEAPTNAPGLDGVHRIALDGTFTPDVAAVPPGQLDGGLIVSERPVQHAVRGGEVILYFPLTETLVRADFDATPTSATWETLPGPGHEGRVRSFYPDPGSDELLAVLDDGTVLRAGSDRSAWESVDLAIALPLATRVQPLAIGRLPDGRRLVYVALYDGRVGAPVDAPSPIAPSAYLISDAP